MQVRLRDAMEEELCIDREAAITEIMDPCESGKKETSSQCVRERDSCVGGYCAVPPPGAAPNRRGYRKA